MKLVKSFMGRQSNSRSGLYTFALGSLFGFFVASTLSGVLSLQLFADDQSHSVAVTNHALRALASIRHFPEINGWGLVHVFYGNNSHLPVRSSTTTTSGGDVWFGAFQQDHLVSQVLNGKRGGFFVDLASNHAIESSKTYALETHYGWNGLCIESDPQHWESMSFRRCDVVGALVGDTRMKDNGPTNLDSSKKGINPRESPLRYTVKLQEILERFEAPRVIDYLSINMEGLYENSLESFPFSRYRFNVITVEKPSPRVTTELEDNGYIKLLELSHSGESLWIHRSIQDKVDQDALKVEAAKISSNVRLEMLTKDARH